MDWNDICIIAMKHILSVVIQDVGCFSVQEVELGLVDLVCRMRESSLQPGEDTCYKRIEPQMCRVQKYQCIIRP